MGKEDLYNVERDMGLFAAYPAGALIAQFELSFGNDLRVVTLLARMKNGSHVTVSFGNVLRVITLLGGVEEAAFQFGYFGDEGGRMDLFPGEIQL